MGKTTSLLWMCIPVLGLGRSAAGETKYIVHSSSEALDVYGRDGEVTQYVEFSGLPTSACATSVRFYVTVDDQGNEAKFWCSDYEVYVGNDTRGAWYYCIWDRAGAKTDTGADDDSEDDSDIYLVCILETEFNGDPVNQKWYVAVRDNRVHGGFFMGVGRLTHFGVGIFYQVRDTDLVDAGETYRSFSPRLVTIGQPFCVDCAVRNDGTGSTDDCSVMFRASTDTSITKYDYGMATVPLRKLSPGDQTNCLWCGDFPSSVPAGEYWVGWMIDTQDENKETDETNNTAYEARYKLCLSSGDETAWGRLSSPQNVR